MNQEKYIGMYVHQATISVAVIEHGVRTLKEARLSDHHPRCHPRDEPNHKLCTAAGRFSVVVPPFMLRAIAANG